MQTLQHGTCQTVKKSDFERLITSFMSESGLKELKSPMLLTTPVEGDSCSDDADPAQDGHDGQNHGVATQTSSPVDVALLQTVPGLSRNTITLLHSFS